MPKLKKSTTIEHEKAEKQRYVVKNTVHWKDMGSVVMVFLISFFLCFFSVKFLFSLFFNQTKIEKNNSLKISKAVKLPAFSFSKTVKVLSSLLPQAQYDYYQAKRQFIDPVLVKEILDKKDTKVLIVDIRSKDEYKSAHIKTAISVPAYTDSKNIYSSLTKKTDIRIDVSKFVKGKKLIVIYGYRPDADVTEDVYDDLKQIFPVRVINVSWNDWKNNFYSWLPNAEKQNFVINTYIEGIDVIEGIGLPHI